MRSCNHSCSGERIRITYSETCLLTPRSTVLLEKRTRFQLVKKFPAFYGNGRFITAFSSSRHARMREFSAGTSTSLTFSWFFSAPPGECDDVRLVVPSEALLMTQTLLDVPLVTPQPFKMKAMPSFETSGYTTQRHGVTSQKICIIKRQDSLNMPRPLPRPL